MLLLQKAQEQIERSFAHIDKFGHAAVKRVAVLQEGELVGQIAVDRPLDALEQELAVRCGIEYAVVQEVSKLGTNFR